MVCQFFLTFNYSVSEKTKGSLPDKPGIYLIRLSKTREDGTVASKLIFIGKTNSLFNEFNGPESSLEKLNKQIENTDKFLTVAYATYNGGELNLKRIAATLVYVNHPKLNTKGLITFPYDTTKVIVSGPRTSGLKTISEARRLELA